MLKTKKVILYTISCDQPKCATSLYEEFESKKEAIEYAKWIGWEFKNKKWTCELKNIKENKMTKCKYAKKYKGIRAPKCGCDYCKEIYEHAQLNKFIDKAAREVEKWPSWMKGKADG
jgi:hypothetical protein